MKERRERIEYLCRAGIYLTMGAMLLLAGFLTVRGTAAFVLSRQAVTGGQSVVLDPGHGGDDPGKVGEGGVLEKDLNLQIARKVERLLRQEGIEAVMTRTDGEGLCDSDAAHKKVQDMKRRIALIEESAPTLTVSIHQNSYPEASVKGAQVFYYKDSTDSKQAAEIMQKSLRERLNPENHREAKANGSYYLLKKTSLPIIIVECGFLSNPEEAEALTQEQYQEQVAWAIFMGIMQSLNTSRE